MSQDTRYHLLPVALAVGGGDEGVQRAVLVAAGAVTVAAAESTHGKPAAPSRHRDYIGDTGSGNQCGKPVAQRTGGWLCPPDSAK